MDTNSENGITTTIMKTLKLIDGNLNTSDIACLIESLNLLGFESHEKIHFEKGCKDNANGANRLGIYVFCIYLTENASKDEFIKLWAKRDKEKVPRLNEQNKDTNTWMYVGKNFENVDSRVKEHLGERDNTNYALKLGCLEYKDFDIDCYRFTLKSNKISKDVEKGYVSMMEGILHDKLKPLIGKK